ncbi:hypothetical protein [Aliagarivorans marinus]|nr:hypothetical protein [Aliagarivorans marinus]
MLVATWLALFHYKRLIAMHSQRFDQGNKQAFRTTGIDGVN